MAQGAWLSPYGWCCLLTRLCGQVCLVGSDTACSRFFSQQAPSLGPLRVLAPLQHLVPTAAFAVVRTSLRRRVMFTLAVGSTSDCASTSRSCFRSSADALACPLTATSLLRDWPHLSAPAILPYALGSNASGPTVVALPAPLAGLMLAVPSAKAGAAPTARNPRVSALHVSTCAFDFPAPMSATVHTSSFVAV
jgi:hypothetical protein